MKRWRILYNLLKNTHPKIGAEIGIQKGIMTEKVLTLLPTIEKYYAIDPWLWYPRYKESLNDKFRDKWNQEKLVSDYNTFRERTKPFADKIITLRMMSREAHKHIKNHSLDFGFIDGNHSYKFVLDDIYNFIPKIKAGGLLGGHDYDLPGTGVKEAVDEAFSGAAEILENNTWWVAL